MTSTDTRPQAQPAIGIDLGTTFSAVAYLDATGRPVTVLNGAGDLLTPSAISFDDEQIIVGKEAIKSSVFEPHLFADCFKRDMGRHHFRRTIGDLEVPPEVLSGFILQRLTIDAERRLGPIRTVVITVPAFFDESRRKATQEAGRLAGLEVMDIINEPTAAAIAFGFYRKNTPGLAIDKLCERILIYDLGGGTFDVTILEIKGQTFRTLATDGDVQLGGKDFDERLVNLLAERFVAANGIDPRSDPHDAAQLWMDAQEAKHALSERAKVGVACFHAGIRMRADVTRDEFNKLTADLLERTEVTTQQVLRQAKLDWDAIDRILLVGGSSRMPMVAEMLRRASGKEPDRSMSPDEVVAHGAALYAGLLMAKSGSSQPAFEVVNVNSHSLGIVGIDQTTNSRRNVVLIPKNTPLPCRAVRKFVTAAENQRNVKIAVVEGESQRPEHCIALGECVVRDLPPGLSKGTSVEVEYRYAANGRLSVLARVPAARQSAAVNIEANAPQNLENLEIWRRRLCPSALPDSDCRVPISNEVSQGGSPDSSNSSSTIARLDELYTQLGKNAAKSQVPDSLKRSQAAATECVKELKAAVVLLQQVEQKQLGAVGQAESLQAGAKVASAKQELHQAQTKSNFTYMVLGRDCVTANHCPPRMESLIAEIQSLQRTHASHGPN